MFVKNIKKKGEKNMKIIDIKWCTDEEIDGVNLPNEVSIDTGIVIEDIADYLSNEYGYLVESFSVATTPLDITKQAIKKGFDKKCIWLDISPDGNEVVCYIGYKGSNVNWFYFGGLAASYVSVEAYQKSIPLNQIINDIYIAITDIGEVDIDEYDFYRLVLAENGCFSETDFAEVRKEIYRMYQLDWMIRNGYSLQDILNVCREGAVEMAIDSTLDSDMNIACNQIEEYYNEQGFNGSMYVCFDEFFNAEYRDINFVVNELILKKYNNESLLYDYLEDIKEIKGE